MAEQQASIATAEQQTGIMLHKRRESHRSFTEVEKDSKPSSRSSRDFCKPLETSAAKASTISLQSTVAREKEKQLCCDSPSTTNHSSERTCKVILNGNIQFKAYHAAYFKQQLSNDVEGSPSQDLVPKGLELKRLG